MPALSRVNFCLDFFFQINKASYWLKNGENIGWVKKQNLNKGRHSICQTGQSHLF